MLVAKGGTGNKSTSLSQIVADRAQVIIRAREAGLGQNHSD
jgi:hypothetical protein